MLGRFLAGVVFVAEVTAPPVLTATPGAAEDGVPDEAGVDGELESSGFDPADPEDDDVDGMPLLGVVESLGELVEGPLADGEDELADDDGPDPESEDVSADATPQP